MQQILHFILKLLLLGSKQAVKCVVLLVYLINYHFYCIKLILLIKL
jgi:hypothetical protein